MTSERSNAMKNLNIVAFSLLFSAIGAAAAMAADLTVTVKEVRNAAGSVRIAVYDSATSFMQRPQAKMLQQAKASQGDVRFVIHDLPAGKYAVVSFHDENDSGKIDIGPLGIPTQGYGFSNDAPTTEGPPAFSQAAFDFDGKSDKAVGFSLTY
jgi:uncharacterized protein (DUF2141 family)